MNTKALLFAAVSACSVLFSANAAFAQDAPATTPAPEAKKDPVVCRVDRATGSRVRVNRVCMKRSEWDEMQHNVRGGIEEISRNGRGPSTIGAMGPN